MKTFNPYRLLIAGIFLVLPGMITAQENDIDQASQESIECILNTYHSQVSEYDFYSSNDREARMNYVILDQKDKTITQGWKDDVMVEYFVDISDFLIEIDDTRYYRLSYENDIMLSQRLSIR